MIVTVERGETSVTFSVPSLNGPPTDEAIAAAYLDETGEELDTNPAQIIQELRGRRLVFTP